MRQISRSFLALDSRAIERAGRFPQRCSAYSLPTTTVLPGRFYITNTEISSSTAISSPAETSTSAGSSKSNVKPELTYQPAQTWEGLEWAGTEEWARKTKEPEFSPRSNYFRPQLHSRDELETVFESIAVRSGADDPSKWRAMSLAKQTVKFAAIKDIQGRTGRRIPDIDINKSETLGELFDAINLGPPTQRVAHKLAKIEELVSLPNVTVSRRKPRLAQKETSLGRWKYIQEELMGRGLPLTPRKPSSLSSGA